MLSQRDTREQSSDIREGMEFEQCYSEKNNVSPLKHCYTYTFFIWLPKDTFKCAAVCTVTKLNSCRRWLGEIPQSTSIVKLEVGKSRGGDGMRIP